MWDSVSWKTDLDRWERGESVWPRIIGSGFGTWRGGPFGCLSDGLWGRSWPGMGAGPAPPEAWPPGATSTRTAHWDPPRGGQHEDVMALLSFISHSISQKSAVTLALTLAANNGQYTDSQKWHSSTIGKQELLIPPFQHIFSSYYALWSFFQKTTGKSVKYYYLMKDMNK